MQNTLDSIKNPETLHKLGRLLRQIREQQGLTQADASRRVRGLRQATISKMERGGDATVDTLISYATALGMELALAPSGKTAPGVNTAAARGDSGLGKTTPTLLEQFADLQDEDS